jgi:hypothetical protein
MLAPIAQTELEREVKEVGGSTQATKPRGEQQLSPCTRPGEEPGQEYEHDTHVIDAAWMHGEVLGDLEQDAARRQARIRGRPATMREAMRRRGKPVGAGRRRKRHGGTSRRAEPGGEVVQMKKPARHATKPAGTVKNAMVRRRDRKKAKHAALGVDKAERKRRLESRRIRGRQSPQIRTTGLGENPKGKHVCAGDGGDVGSGVDWRDQRTRREAISHGRWAKRGEDESKRHHSSTQQRTHVPTNSPQGIPHSGYG